MDKELFKKLHHDIWGGYSVAASDGVNFYLQSSAKEQYMLSLIGALVGKNYGPPEGVDPDAWRVGYGNAISDLIKEIWPDKPGARRITLEELKAEDLRRMKLHG